MTIYDYEMQMWETAKSRSKDEFLSFVDENAVMVCGGYRCSGKDYADIISQFDCKEYTITDFEIVAESDSLVQVHYILSMSVADERNSDLAGTFHITSTWKKSENTYKLIFNMDSRIM